MRPIPAWAQEMTLEALIAARIEAIPEITWRHRDGRCSSGRCWPDQNRLIINAGQDRIDQQVVLLHEIAHLAAPIKDCHSDTFWDIAWRLYRLFGLPINYCKKREGTYRKGALAAYDRAMKEAAK